jgi:potassium/hydrogen antiporter
VADVTALFFAVAGVTVLGFVAGRVFERTRFPDIPLLLGAGLLLGPVNRLATEHGVGIQALADALDPETLRAAAPFMSGLALVVILFDAGLKIEFAQFRRSLAPALLHTMPIFLLTVAGLAAIGIYVMGMPPIVAVVLGVALSNVGQTVSAAILRTMRVSQETRSIGFVEMAIYDTISIPILVALFAFADGAGSAALGDSLQRFVQVTSISLVIGGAAGTFWSFALRRLEDHPNSYMLTLALLLAVYAGTNVLGGSGAVAVLLFGLVVGNRASLLRFLHRRAPPAPPPSEKVQAFHDEITFLVRTVFFLFLGANFRLDLAGAWPVTSRIPFLAPLDHRAALFVLAVMLLVLWFMLARWLAIQLVSARLRPETRFLIPIFGHGLGTAVLATLPFVAPQYIEGTPFHALFAPWEPVFVNAALVIIVVTVTLSSLLVWRQERGRPDPAPPAPAPARPAAPATGAAPAPARHPTPPPARPPARAPAPKAPPRPPR